ncbi:MAG: hypothetical protein R3B89_31870 [Polyangiaceae bacterium]
MTIWDLVLGAGLGALGGALHLGLTRWRAGQIREGRALLILATYPLGLVSVAICVVGAAALARQAAWAAVLGLAAVQLIWIGRAARRLERR